MARDGEEIGGHVESLTAEIVEHVALLEDKDPLELQPPLQSVIDLDAVEAIMAPSDNCPRDGAVSLAFEYRDYQVMVERDDDVTVRVNQSRPR
ncbi:hypothetical protein HWV07_07135 [Natronomonas salina]|uniref:HalOD1 output domain-containing protein n=1 Tax=Natronomonas salina TaxID=1710540 RepID=UPI0015B5BB94|nr:HalOD1 output domain-containing protein [Natronomonas salina]QLD88819.1 hypothetical protein HWV07_07135 [Natronomonas salina]